MPRFRVLARDAAGNRIREILDAVNQTEVQSQLRNRNLTVISINEEASRPARSGVKREEAIKYRFLPGGPPRPRVKSRDLVVFTRQFATMIASAIPMLECLDILAEQAEDPGFKLVLNRVIEDVRAGIDLSAALGKHPRVFSGIYVNMIRAGEKAGRLDEILLRLAEYQESTEKLKQQIKAAMIFPVASLFLVLIVTAVLLIFVIPQFEQIFEGMVPGGKAKLPGPTKVVLRISRLFRDYYLYTILGVVGFVLAVRAFKQTENGAYAWDRLKLSMPVLGPLVQKIALSRFSRTFSTLIKSGVSFLEAIEIVAATAGNKVVERAVLASREAIVAGEPLHKPLADSPVFPPMVVRMVAIGERSGQLEPLLEKISQFYDEEVSSSVESLTALIEPLMIGTMALLVGGIVLAVFLPILELQGQLAGGG